LFTGVSVDDEEGFIKQIEEELKKLGLYDKYLDYNLKSHDYHMTVMGGERLEPLRRYKDLNKQVKLNLTGIGFSNDAMAVRVEGDYFSRRENQHITIAFNNFPVDSNNIEWDGDGFKPVDKPFSVVGTVKEFYKEDNLDEAIKHPHYNQRIADRIDGIEKINIDPAFFKDGEDENEIKAVIIERIKKQLRERAIKLQDKDFPINKKYGVLLGCISVKRDNKAYDVEVFLKPSDEGVVYHGKCYSAVVKSNILITIMLSTSPDDAKYVIGGEHLQAREVASDFHFNSNIYGKLIVDIDKVKPSLSTVDIKRDKIVKVDLAKVKRGIKQIINHPKHGKLEVLGATPTSYTEAKVAVKSVSTGINMLITLPTK